MTDQLLWDITFS